MKIAIIGAAGLRTPLIVQAMALRQDRIGLTELALMDIDEERLDLIAALTTPLESSGELRFTINRTTDARDALRGARFVIATFRVGGMESRVADERVALKHGVLGQETTGAGGFAMAMRTIPVLFHYIDLMRELCPDAWLINFANPAGLLAEAALRVKGWGRTVGICDAPAAMQRVAAALLRAPARDVFLDYFGLNHLGWARAISFRGMNVLPGFLDQIETLSGFPELPFTPALLRRLGMIPNEYLYYYYSTRQSIQNLLGRGQTRGEQLLAMNQRLFCELKELRAAEELDAMQRLYVDYLAERGQTYMAVETGGNGSSLGDIDPAVAEAISSAGYAGVALDLIEGLSGQVCRTMPLNVLNRGAVWGMADDDVVEVPVVVEKNVVRPLAVGKIPDECLGLMKLVKTYERLTIAAAVEGSRDQAVQALTIHPLVADEAVARSLVDAYTQAHGDVWPRLT